MNLQRFFKDTINNGGSSFNLLTGEYNPNDGFMVAIKGHEFQIPIEDFNHKVLSDYIKENADLLISGVTDDKFLGSWIDDGIVYLDCSVKFDRIVPALESGIDQGELAIWSNENKTSISCTQDNLDFHKNILIYKTMEKSVIKKFIDTFCTQVREDDNVELMMDDHKCISFSGIEYYVPEISYNKESSKIYDYLIDNHQVV